MSCKAGAAGRWAALGVGVLLGWVVAMRPACAAGCPAPESFQRFFARYSSDRGFELARTAFPLSYLEHEYGIDENGKDDSSVIRSVITRAEFARRKTLGEELRAGEVKVFGDKRNRRQPGRRILTIGTPDSDAWVIDYHFARRGGCWFLVQMDNVSL